MKDYTYFSNCTEQPAESLDEMIENSREIKYITILKYVAYAELMSVFDYYVHRKDQGLTLRDDWQVTYFKSTFEGKPCVYVVHSAIEYIFIKSS